MVVVLLAVAVLAVVELALRVGRVAGRPSLLPVGASVTVLGSGLERFRCVGDARGRLVLFAGSS